jgi:hypothetical protein
MSPRYGFGAVHAFAVTHSVYAATVTSVTSMQNACTLTVS